MKKNTTSILAGLIAITLIGSTNSNAGFLGINCSKSKPPIVTTQAAVTNTAPAQAPTQTSSGSSTTAFIPKDGQSSGATPDVVTFYPVSTNGGPIGMVGGKPVYIPNGSSKNVTIKFALADGRASITMSVDSGENAEIFLLPGHYTVTWTVSDSSIEGVSTLTVGNQATDYVVGKGKAYAGLFTLANQR